MGGTGNGVHVCANFRATPDVGGGCSSQQPSQAYQAGIVADLEPLAPWSSLRSSARPSCRDRPAIPTLDSSLYLKYAGHNTANPYVFYYFDIVSGSNGLPAGPGYDLVTDLGDLLAPHAGPL